MVESRSCEAWNMTLNSSTLQVPANTFKHNQTYVIVLSVSAPARAASFDQQIVRHPPVLFYDLYLVLLILTTP